MMNNRIQTILILLVTTLFVSALLFVDLVTSASAGDQAVDPDLIALTNLNPAPDSANAPDALMSFFIEPSPDAGKINVDGNLYGDGDTLEFNSEKSLTPSYDGNYWQFTHWSGTYVTTTSPLILSPIQDYTVIANFARSCFDLILKS